MKLMILMCSSRLSWGRVIIVFGNGRLRRKVFTFSVNACCCTLLALGLGCLSLNLRHQVVDFNV